MERPLNQHVVSFDGCVIMSSSVIHLTVPVLCRSHLTWRTAAMESILRKNWKTNKTRGSVCVLFNLLHLLRIFSLFFSSYFFLFNIYIYFLSFIFVHVYCIKLLITTEWGNCSGGRKIEYKVVIYSRVWKKLRKMWCAPMRCCGSIRNETPT
jgi:hypothetical protein